MIFYLIAWVGSLTGTPFIEGYTNIQMACEYMVNVVPDDINTRRMYKLENGILTKVKCVKVDPTPCQSIWEIKPQ